MGEELKRNPQRQQTNSPSPVHHRRSRFPKRSPGGAYVVDHQNPLPPYRASFPQREQSRHVPNPSRPTQPRLRPVRTDGLQTAGNRDSRSLRKTCRQFLGLVVSTSCLLHEMHRNGNNQIDSREKARRKKFLTHNLPEISRQTLISSILEVLDKVGYIRLPRVEEVTRGVLKLQYAGKSLLHGIHILTMIERPWHMHKAWATNVSLRGTEFAAAYMAYSWEKEVYQMHFSLVSAFLFPRDLSDGLCCDIGFEATG